MNTKTSIFAAVIGVIALAVSSVAIASPHQTTFVQKAPAVQNVKGISSDFSNVPYINVNGVTEWYATSQFRVGTTTLCSFPAPVASSIIQFVSVRNTTGSTSSQVVSIGTSTNVTSTSSLLVSNTIAANATTTFGWETTTFAPSVIQPNQYLNVVSDSLTTASGYCQAEFTQI